MARALVTGGGGFLGLHLVRQLVSRGDEVIACGRHTYPEAEALGAQSVVADVRDGEALSRIMKNVDEVYHTAALAGIWGKWEDFYSTNYEGTLRVIEACMANGVRKLIYTSSPSVVFDRDDQQGINEDVPYPSAFLSPYPKTKALAEKAVMQANGKGGLFTVSLRPSHLIWGPGDRHLIPRVVDRARAGKLVRVGPCTNLVDVIYVENAARAHLQAAAELGPGGNCNGKTYFINQERPVPLWGFIDEILQRSGVPPAKKAISFRQAYGIGASLELIHTLFRKKHEPRMTRFLACVLATDHFYDSKRAQRDFGYRPTISVEEGLDRLFS